jgi:hypothetical protein
MLAESGCENPDDVTRWAHNPANQADLADALLQVLKSKLSRRTIRSFFMVDVASNGYRLWAPQMRAPKGAGTALARHIAPTSAGDVGIDVLRYSVEEEVPVRAYEWCAELREDAANETPDAIACGMAYVFKREYGLPTRGEWDLLTAADCMADVDFLQVSAFFEQHTDALTLIDAGDLAFVWLWERRAGVLQAQGGRACKQRSPTCVGACAASGPSSST